MTPGALIKHHEGFKDHVYSDSLGNLTCGWGHLLAVGTYVQEIIADLFFADDLIEALNTYYSLGLDLDVAREAALIDMCFNLGNKIKRFKKMLYYLENRDWKAAAYHAEHSLWYTQVKRRGRNIVKIIRTGEIKNLE